MPYEPHSEPSSTVRPTRRLRRRVSNTILGAAAILCFVLSLFNLYVAYPNGIPPEFPLFVTLTFVFAVLWLFTRNAKRKT